MDPILIGFGLGVGVLVGMTGIGGGSLMTPLLILVFGVNPITAVGTDLAYAAVTKTVGGYKHWLQKTVDLRLCAWMAVGSVPAAIGGVYVLDVLQSEYGSGVRQRAAEDAGRRAPPVGRGHAGPDFHEAVPGARALGGADGAPP